MSASGVINKLQCLIIANYFIKYFFVNICLLFLSSDFLEANK